MKQRYFHGLIILLVFFLFFSESLIACAQGRSTGNNGASVDKQDYLHTFSGSDIGYPESCEVDPLFARGDDAEIADMPIRLPNGTEYHINDFSEDHIVFIFGRSRCGNTNAMNSIADMAQMDGKSIKIIMMDVDQEDDEIPDYHANHPNTLISFTEGSYINNGLGEEADVMDEKASYIQPVLNTSGYTTTKIHNPDKDNEWEEEVVLARPGRFIGELPQFDVVY